MNKKHGEKAANINPTELDYKRYALKAGKMTSDEAVSKKFDEALGNVLAYARGHHFTRLEQALREAGVVNKAYVVNLYNEHFPEQIYARGNTAVPLPGTADNVIQRVDDSMLDSYTETQLGKPFVRGDENMHRDDEARRELEANNERRKELPAQIRMKGLEFRHKLEQYEVAVLKNRDLLEPKHLQPFEREVATMADLRGRRHNVEDAMATEEMKLALKGREYPPIKPQDMIDAALKGKIAAAGRIRFMQNQSGEVLAKFNLPPGTAQSNTFMLYAMSKAERDPANTLMPLPVRWSPGAQEELKDMAEKLKSGDKVAIGKAVHDMRLEINAAVLAQRANARGVA